MGAVTCFVIGITFMYLTLWSAIVYVPLFLAAFVLSIVAMAQRRVAGGVAMLLLTVVAPPVLYAVLFAMRAKEGMEHVAKSMAEAEERRRSPAHPAAGGPSARPTPDVQGNTLEGAAASEAGVATQHAGREKREYLRSVHLYDLKAKYYDSILDQRVPGVQFKLRNAGERTLARVEVTVYFEDAWGNVVAEEDYVPVLLSSYRLEQTKPLRPGYIWQMERGKFYQAKSVPSEWQEGKVHAKVTDVEFASAKDAKRSGLNRYSRFSIKSCVKCAHSLSRLAASLGQGWS
ncbi:MAG: hypothetical protein FJ291_26770 [Planctomycetes bacterium]|nr:hypothetical protein [Planctomycetota bacterium]